MRISRTRRSFKKTRLMRPDSHTFNIDDDFSRAQRRCACHAIVTFILPLIHAPFMPDDERRHTSARGILFSSIVYAASVSTARAPPAHGEQYAVTSRENDVNICRAISLLKRPLARRLPMMMARYRPWHIFYLAHNRYTFSHDFYTSGSHADGVILLFTMMDMAWRTACHHDCQDIDAAI